MILSSPLKSSQLSIGSSSYFFSLFIVCRKRHHWHADEDSEQRRLALLPQTVPLTWDQLMHDPAYQRALERLP